MIKNGYKVSDYISRKSGLIKNKRAFIIVTMVTPVARKPIKNQTIVIRDY